MDNLTRNFVLQLLASFRAGKELRFDDKLITSVSLKTDKCIKLDFVFDAPVILSYANLDMTDFIALVRRFEA